MISAFIERYRQAIAQLTRFGIVGVINTGVDFGVYILLTRLSDFWNANRVAAAAVSFVCAVISSFILNTFWTFRSDLHRWHHKLLKFMVVALGGLGWNVLVFFLLHRMGMHDIAAKAFADAIVIAWNFVLQKNWTYKS
jgi:putative flippase GtrA